MTLRNIMLSKIVRHRREHWVTPFLRSSRTRKTSLTVIEVRRWLCLRGLDTAWDGGLRDLMAQSKCSIP